MQGYSYEFRQGTFVETKPYYKVGMVRGKLGGYFTEVPVEYKDKDGSLIWVPVEKVIPCDRAWYNLPYFMRICLRLAYKLGVYKNKDNIIPHFQYGDR